MKNKLLNSILLFITAFVLLFSVLCAAVIGIVTLQHGDAMPSEPNGTVYSLSADTTSSPFVYHYASSEGQGDFKLLVFCSAPFSVEINGKLIYDYQRDYYYQYLHAIPFPEASDGLIVMKIESTSKMTRSMPVFLAGSEMADVFFKLYNEIDVISMGMILLAIFYSITLYIFKPQDTYLLMLSVMAFSLLFLGTPVFPIRNSNIAFEYLRSGMITVYSCLCAKICADMPDTKRSKLLLRLTSWKALIMIVAIRLIAKAAGLDMLRNALRYAVIAISIYAVIDTNIRGSKTAKILLVGLSMSTAYEVFTMMFMNNWQVSLDMLVVWRVSRLGNMPLLLAVITAINMRFAANYTGSELMVKKLDYANASLDLAVREATERLRSEQAEKHNMMINIFHDLRSPLFVVKGSLDILEKDLDGNRDLIPMMQERVNFLSRLTEDLFTIAKLENGNLLFSDNDVDLEQVVNNVENWAQVASESKNITVVVSAQKCHVWGDAHRLEQMLQNLVENAIHFTPAGRPMYIELKTEGSYAVIHVRDTGKGISPDKFCDIFKRYYRVEQPSDPEKGVQSSGLGLSIAKEIAKHHKGDITVESEVGQGADFIVKLPLNHHPAGS